VVVADEIEAKLVVVAAVTVPYLYEIENKNLKKKPQNLNTRPLLLGYFKYFETKINHNSSGRDF